jgi:uncharacterized ferritin-like protein (DUF455 family)
MRCLIRAGLDVLHCRDPVQKVELSMLAVRDWRAGVLRPVQRDLEVPDGLTLPDNVVVVHPKEVQKRGVGSLRGHQALLHSYVLIIAQIGCCFHSPIR